VHKVLTNEAYTGTLVWGATARDGAPPVRVDNAFPAIVSGQEFGRVQRLLGEKAPRAAHPRRVASPYLLSGLAKCATCGSAMTAAESKGGRYAYYVCQTLLKQGGGGSVVNVISVEAKIARAADLAYATASGALYTFTGKAGRALAPHGIRVNAVSPGTTDTARNDALYGYPRSQEWRDRLQTIPLGRAGSPEEIGSVIAWLCSKDAEFIVGQCIEIDGGQAA